MAVQDYRPNTGQSLFVALDKLEEQVTCFVCKEQFTDPRTLPCLHSFCLECIKQLLVNLRGPADENLIKCPMCSKLVVLSGNPLGASLPLAHHLTSLIDVKQDFFLPLTYELSSSLCKIHREEMKLYCLTCSVGVCLECTVGDHTHHELRRLRLSELYLPEEGEEDGWIKVSHPGLVSSLIDSSYQQHYERDRNSSPITRGATPTATAACTSRIDEGSLESHQRLNKENMEQVQPLVPETRPLGPPSRNISTISGLPTFQQYSKVGSLRSISHNDTTDGVSRVYSTITPTQQVNTGTTTGKTTGTTTVTTTATTTGRVTGTTTSRATSTNTGTNTGTTAGRVTGTTTGRATSTNTSTTTATTTGRVTGTTTGRVTGTTTGRATSTNTGTTTGRATTGSTTSGRATGTGGTSCNNDDGIFQVILKEYELVRT